MDKFKKKLIGNRLFELTISGMLKIMSFEDVIKYVHCGDRVDAYCTMMDWFWNSDDSNDDKPGFDKAFNDWEKLLNDVCNLFQDLSLDKDYKRPTVQTREDLLTDDRFSIHNRNLMRTRLEHLSNPPRRERLW